jgi:hypothetical protein
MAKTRRVRRSSTLEATAYHEAGHAVISIVLLCGVRRLSIIPNDDDGSFGRCTHNPLAEEVQQDCDTTESRRDIIEARVMVLYAGFHAEARFVGRHNYVGAREDMKNASDLLSFLAGEEEELEKYLDWLSVRSKNLVLRPENWRAIRYVARELIARRELSGEEVRCLYDHARRDHYRKKTGRAMPEVKINAGGELQSQ